MNEFGERIKGLGKKGAQAAVPAVMLVGSILGQPSSGKAENQGKTTPNQDNPHSLYIDNPGLVEQAIERLELNIPRLAQIDLQGPPNPYTFRDNLGRERIQEFNNWTSGDPHLGNRAGTRVGTFRDQTLNITDQTRESLYPETRTDSNTFVLIGGLAANPRNHYEYIAVPLRQYDFSRIVGTQPTMMACLRVEAITDYNYTDITAAQAEHIAFPTAGLPCGDIVSDTVKSITVNSVADKLIVESKGFVDLANNRVQEIGLNSTGRWSEDYWTIVSKPNLTMSPTATTTSTVAATFTPTRTEVIPTSTKTGTATPSRTPTPTVTVGGGLRAVSLSDNPVEFGWQARSDAGANAVVRISPNRLPEMAALLPASTTFFRDNSGVSGVACYMNVFLGFSNEMVGLSNILCIAGGTKSGNSPEGVRVSLAGNMTRFSYTANSSEVEVLGVFGSIPRFIPGVSGETSILDNTGGLPTLYSLFKTIGGSVTGNSNFFYVFPGIER